jgi:hypothetical protein
MTDAPKRTSEIAAYLAAVERHLGDLPEAIRLDLMSELDLHLAEVAADVGPGMTLRDLLGSPESYARELRETAEVQKEPATARLRRSLLTAAAPLANRTRAAADKFAASTGHDDAADLALRLRPGWWVLRGAIVAALFVYWLAGAQFGVSGYSLFGSVPGLIFAVAVLLVCVWISLRIGAKTPEWGQRRRRWTAVAGVAIIALAGYQFSWMITGAAPVEYIETYVEGGAYDHVTDIHVYDEDGRQLTGVYLFDQNGDPLWIGDPTLCEGSAWRDPFAEETDEYGQTVDDQFTEDGESSELGYQYPLCDGSGENGATPTPTPTETRPPGEGTPSEQPTETTDPGESPTETGAPTSDAPTTAPGGEAPTTK